MKKIELKQLFAIIFCFSMLPLNVACQTSDGELLTIPPQQEESHKEESPDESHKDDDDDVVVTPPVTVYPEMGDETWCGTIHADEYYGRVLSKLFFDLKCSAGGINNDAKAQMIFVEDDMNGIRCSIFGNESSPAHPEAGVVIESYYAKTIKSINYAKKARGGKPLTIFASKKLQGPTSFPDWVKGESGVDPDKYSQLLFDFVKFMSSKGIVIGVLGIDNEIEWSKSGLTPENYYKCAIRLKERLSEAGLPIPLLIGPERFRVHNGWMGTFFANKDYITTMDIYGMHYYPDQRDNCYEPLKKDLQIKGDLEFWATEPHWNIEAHTPDEYTDVLHYAEDTIGALWDQTDWGLDNLMWWQYSRSGDTRGNLMYHITVPIFGAQPIKVTDHDGWDIRESRLLQTRAFRRGNDIILYILNLCGNDTKNENYINYRFTMDGAKLKGLVATQRQWRDDALREGETRQVRIYDRESIYLNLPSRSITKIELTIE